MTGAWWHRGHRCPPWKLGGFAARFAQTQRDEFARRPQQQARPRRAHLAAHVHRRRVRDGDACERRIREAKCIIRRIVHHACRVAAWRAGVTRVLSEHVEHVAEVEADGTDVQQQLVSADWR